MASPPVWPLKRRRSDSVSLAEGVPGHSNPNLEEETSGETTPSTGEAHDLTETLGLPNVSHRLPDHEILDASVWDEDMSDPDEETQRLELEDLECSSDSDDSSVEDSDGNESDLSVQDMSLDEDHDGTNTDEEVQVAQLTRTMSVDLPLPEELQRLEMQVTMSRNTSSQSIVSRYRKFLEKLCLSTQTEVEVQYTLARLPLAIGKIGSIQLDRIWLHDPIMDLFAHALIVHVWQLICFKVQTGYVYDEGTSLSSHSASLFLSAYYTYRDTPSAGYTSQGEFKAATEHFEARFHEVGGDKTWLTSQLLAHIPDPDLEDTVTRNELASEYLQVLEERGLSYFTRYILEKEIHKEATEGPQSSLRNLKANTDLWNFTHDQLFITLVHMGPEMIKAIIKGQVSRLAEISCNSISNRLHQNGRTQSQPGTYMNSICDRQGLSPTPHQWLNVCDMMLLYVEQGEASDDLADSIDQMFPNIVWRSEFSRQGLRRYTDWKSKVKGQSNEPCGRLRELVKEFVFHLKARMMHDIEYRGRHVPLTAPLAEYGFGTSPQRKLKDDREHRNSNFLMNLAEASFQHLYPGMFRLQQYVLFLCFREAQCWLSEIFLTQLGQGYIHNGGGFSHNAAGRSYGGNYRNIPAGNWERYTEKAADEGLLEKISENTRDAVERLDALKAEDEQLQRIEDAVDEVFRAIADMVNPQ